MKRVLSVLLAVCIIFSLSIGVFAATINISADKSKIKAGDEVTVTLKAADAMDKYIAFEYWLYYDADLFDLKMEKDEEGEDVSVGDTNKYVTVSAKFTDSKGSYHKVSALNNGRNFSIAAGALIADLIFVAKSDINTTAQAQFDLVIKLGTHMDDETGKPVSAGDTAGSAVTVTVTPAAQTSKYSVAASTTTSSTTVGSNATVSLDVTNTETSNKYNSYYFEVSYDNTVLQYISNNAGAEATAANGKLTIAGYGADRKDPVVLTFEGLKTGSSAVTITKANIDEAENAHAQNAPEAEITTATVTITVTAATYNVTLDSIFTGDDAATGGQDYTFRAADKEHYDYTNVSATMDGETAQVTDNGDGSYTIASVTGDLVITGTRTAKQYNVTVDGNAANKVNAANKATYNTDFTFTVDTSDNTKTYEVTVKVGGTAVTPTVNDTSYTIAGSAITGDIVITATQTDKPAEKVNVTFEGNATADVTGEKTATKNTAYTFTVTKAEGYTYTVTAKNADGAITLTESNGTYTIAAKDVTKDITITVNKTANRTVEVFDYVKANNTQFWLVTVKGTVADGNVLTYNNAKMYWSEKYEAYAYLVIDTNGKTAAEMKTAAEAAIGEVKGDKTSINYTGDVNATGTVDVNDAQLVYNMYNAKYTSFTSCSMEKFLRADVNGDKSLTVGDAAAIVNTILTK
mgnify:CR=1 FL=1